MDDGEAADFAFLLEGVHDIPEAQDQRVRQAADLLEIRLLDHMIVAGARFVSLRLLRVPGLLEDAVVSIAASP